MLSFQTLRLRTIKAAVALPRKAYSTSQTQFKPAERLSGRTCMITGGTSGIGFAIAERFLQEGVARVILVGRSQQRLENAATRLGAPPEGTDGNGNDVLATRAPENQQQTPGLDGDGNGQQTPSNGRIGLFVGDVSEPGSWMRKLEKEMVDPATLNEHTIQHTNNFAATSRHPHQRSRSLPLKPPPQNHTRRHLTHSPHKPRRRDTHFARPNARLNPQPQPHGDQQCPPTAVKMHH